MTSDPKLFFTNFFELLMRRFTSLKEKGTGITRYEEQNASWYAEKRKMARQGKGSYLTVGRKVC